MDTLLSPPAPRAAPFHLPGSRPPGGAPEPRTLLRPVDPVAAEVVERLAGGGGVESFVVLLAALARVLASWGGADAVEVHAPPLAGTGGPAVALTASPRDGITVEEWIMDTDAAVVRAYRHGAEGGAGGGVLAALDGVHEAHGGGFALAVRFGRGDGGELRAVASFDAAVLEPWVVDALLRATDGVLARFADPSLPLAETGPAPGAAETAWLSAAGQAPPAGVPFEGETLQAAFAAQVRRTPHQPAVVCGGKVLSYAELDARVERTARHLAAEYGAGPGTRVAVLLHKSEVAVAAVLAVLRTGAAYVPLSPGHPLPLLERMLADSGATLLVTESEFLFQLENWTGGLFAADVQTDLPEGAPLPAAAQGGDLAYLIYTSGSTGSPKAVAVEHRAILSYLRWKAAFYGLGRDTVTLQIASLAFDSSVSDLFSTLLTGGCLVVAGERERADPALLEALARRHGATLFAVVPSLYRLLLERLDEPLPALRTVTLAGEPVTADLVREHRARLPGVRLVNEYGPTECSVCCTAADLDGADAALPVIGGPVGSARVRVVDAGLRPVPLGMPGEICVGGAGVARGYHGQPGLTADRFVPDPDEPGARMYRTGDVGRWRPQGVLEFLGRIDTQVKIRGHRVEPGEVEAVLAGCPGVRQAAVAARRHAGEDALVAYVVAPPELATPALRRWMEARLPGYMLPAHYVRLGTLPLNSSGKLDRGALPAPEPDEMGGGLAYVPPRDGRERGLVQIWEAVLHREGIGIDDHFFRLGGHSLRAAQVAFRAQRELGLEIGVRDVFARPTIRELASGPASGALPPLSASGERGPVPASALQAVLLELVALAAGAGLFHLAAEYRVTGPLDLDALREAAAALATRHEVLRARFRRGPAGWEQEAAGAVAPLEVVELDPAHAAEAGEIAALWARHEARRPFDLATEPPFRLGVLRTGAGEHRLSLVLHHAAGDGWSLDLLLRELLHAYRSVADAGSAVTEAAPFQFSDYLRWQRECLRDGHFDAQRAYWRERLRDLSPLTLGSGEGAGLATQRVSVRLPDGVEEAARALGDRTGSTLYVVILTALKVVLARFTGSTDVRVGTNLAARTLAETEWIVGPLLNTVLLRTDLAGDPPFREAVDRVARTTMEAHANQDLPFDQVARDTGYDADGLLPVMFLFQEGGAAPPSVPGLEVAPVPHDGAGAPILTPCELVLDVHAGGGALHATAAFNPLRLDAPFVHHLLAGLAAVLEQAARDP